MKVQKECLECVDFTFGNGTPGNIRLCVDANANVGGDDSFTLGYGITGNFRFRMTLTKFTRVYNGLQDAHLSTSTNSVPKF